MPATKTPKIAKTLSNLMAPDATRTMLRLLSDDWRAADRLLVILEDAARAGGDEDIQRLYQTALKVAYRTA